jgi:hypothetical protein
MARYVAKWLTVQRHCTLRFNERWNAVPSAENARSAIVAYDAYMENCHKALSFVRS